MKQKHNLWFKAKDYGYGWVPCSWQGWLVLLLYVVGLVSTFFALDQASHSVSDTLLSFAVQSLSLTTLFCIVCYLKGEKPYWRWKGKRVFDKKI